MNTKHESHGEIGRALVRGTAISHRFHLGLLAKMYSDYRDAFAKATGLSHPSREELNRIARTLLDWGAKVDLKRLEDYYFIVRVLSPEQYHSLLRLLSVFAEHLVACGNRFMIERKPAPSGPIVKALLHGVDVTSILRTSMTISQMIFGPSRPLS